TCFFPLSDRSKNLLTPDELSPSPTCYLLSFLALKFQPHYLGCYFAKDSWTRPGATREVRKKKLDFHRGNPLQQHFRCRYSNFFKNPLALGFAHRGHQLAAICRCADIHIHERRCPDRINF